MGLSDHSGSGPDVRDGERARLVVEMLPARHGDALLVEYGGSADPHRVLVDVGPRSAFGAVRTRLAELPRHERHVELLVLTHVDGDHVEGVIPLLNDRDLGLTCGDVWFNGYRHLTDDLGAVHGEIVGALLVERRLPWNRAFGGRAVRRDAGDTLPTVTLPGGLRLTVLAPSQHALHDLLPVWEQECRKAGITPGDTASALDVLAGRPALRPPLDSYLGGAVPSVEALAAARTDTDTSRANGSSIVLLAEYADRTLLLTGDAPAATVVEGLDLLAAERGRLPRLDVVKLPHHGSSRNVTRELVRACPSPRYLFSSDGSYHRHPDPEAVARVLVHAPPRPVLVFNYCSDQTRRWDDAELQREHAYRVVLPPPTRPGTRCLV